MKLSVITITYNNEQTIKEYLDSIGTNLPEDSEVIIVDNNSTDNTAKFIKGIKGITFIQSNQNLGFSKANNLAVKKSKGEYLLFLNPDTKVLDDAINKLLRFCVDHQDAGIVAPKLIEPNGQVQPSVRKLPSIWGAIKEFFLGIKGSFKEYVPKGDNPVIVETVVGAAMLIKRAVFDKVGMFNEKYFLYFEDLQLCKDVGQIELKVYYLPTAKVGHQVGGSTSPDKLKQLQESAVKYHGSVNNFILNLVLRLTNKTYLLLFLIVILAFSLRFNNVAQNPPSLNWDEVSIGYNAYSVLKTGRDEWNQFLPLHFKSYGEYKLPVQIYGSIPAIAIFGLNDFSIRITPVVYGTLTVLLMFFLGRALLQSSFVGLISSFLLAISPWHIQLTRASFESSFSVFWLVLGTWFLVKSFKDRKWLFWSILPFVLAMYTYNSARIFTPVFLVFCLSVYWRDFIKQKKILVISLIIFAILAIPVAQFVVSGAGSARYKLVSVTDDPGLVPRINESRGQSTLPQPLPQLIHNKVVYVTGVYVSHYLAHFTPDFLFISGAPHKQHHVQGIGELYLFQAPFLLLGILFLFKDKKKFRWLILGWLLLAFIPVSVTNDSIPHALRTLIAVPTYQFLTAYGLLVTYLWLKRQNKNLQIASFGGGLAVLVVSLGLYLNNYYNIYPKLYSRDWQYGNRQVVEYIAKHRDEYDQIIFTRHYGEPHMFTLFYLKVDPAKFQNDPNLYRFETYDWIRVLRFDKFYFPDLGDNGTHFEDIARENPGKKMLFVGRSGDFPKDIKRLLSIKFLNGNDAFDIVEVK